MFEIGRIRFRPLTRDDLSFLEKWENTFKVTLYARGDPLVFKNTKDIENEFEEYMENDDKQQFILEKKEDDKRIGIATYRDRSNSVKNANIGTYIGEPDEWNKGIGREITLGLCEMLFFQKNYDRLSARSAPFNKRAQTVLEDVGFKETGRARKSGYVFGKRIDWLMFDLLREEYMPERQNLLEEILGERKEEYIKNTCKIRF
ncbi:MAG: GNAT family N-acetyltransferase [Candidatus Thermoplasmatota archaeon]|nr:GNAT family N-acetyltransferase [Candidatus Thermoplasmatota archaeon]MBS3790131.1 GNAT family N-acetyltransferase [Candidatus Thermoplasmatota archaeon]